MCMACSTAPISGNVCSRSQKNAAASAIGGKQCRFGDSSKPAGNWPSCTSITKTIPTQRRCRSYRYRCNRRLRSGQNAFPPQRRAAYHLLQSSDYHRKYSDEAYEYVVNGKSAIEWIMERYQVTTNKDSGIVNDPNDWAREQGNPRYILDLLLSIINVSLQTVEIVRNLPALELGDLSADKSNSVDADKESPLSDAHSTSIHKEKPAKEYIIPAESLPQVAEAKQKEEPNAKIVTLIIKKVYFDAILSGTKNVEYRQLKQTTLNKYTWLNPEDGKRHLKKYDAMRLYVGYNKNRETALVEIVDTVYDKATQTVEFHLGRILERG